MHTSDLNDGLGCTVIRKGQSNKEELQTVKAKCRLGGKHIVEITRKDTGLVEVYEVDNDIVNVGKNMILDTMFNGATPSTTWYCSLISNAAFTALNNTDTMASHSGWAEFGSYSGGVRPTWGSGAASGQAVTNASPVSFTITSNGTLQGIFICDNNTIAGTSGNLWSTASFASTVPVSIGDQVKITYTISS